MPDEPEEFQERLRNDFDARYGKLIEMLDGALSAEMGVRVQGQCPKCECKHIRYVPVPDYKTKLAVAEFIANRVHGRPGTAEGDSERGMIVNYRVEVADGPSDREGLPA